MKLRGAHLPPPLGVSHREGGQREKRRPRSSTPSKGPLGRSPLPPPWQIRSVSAAQRSSGCQLTFSWLLSLAWGPASTLRSCDLSDAYLLPAHHRLSCQMNQHVPSGAFLWLSLLGVGWVEVPRTGRGEYRGHTACFCHSWPAVTELAPACLHWTEFHFPSPRKEYSPFFCMNGWGTEDAGLTPGTGLIPGRQVTFGVY